MSSCASLRSRASNLSLFGFNRSSGGRYFVVVVVAARLESQSKALTIKTLKSLSEPRRITPSFDKLPGKLPRGGLPAMNGMARPSRLMQCLSVCPTAQFDGFTARECLFVLVFRPKRVSHSLRKEITVNISSRLSINTFLRLNAFETETMQSV